MSKIKYFDYADEDDDHAVQKTFSKIHKKKSFDDESRESYKKAKKEKRQRELRPVKSDRTW
jgi:hypothetical protein